MVACLGSGASQRSHLLRKQSAIAITNELIEVKLAQSGAATAIDAMSREDPSIKDLDNVAAAREAAAAPNEVTIAVADEGIEVDGAPDPGIQRGLAVAAQPNVWASATTKEAISACLNVALDTHGVTSRLGNLTVCGSGIDVAVVHLGSRAKRARKDGTRGGHDHGDR